MHARVAVYRITSGTAEEIAGKADAEGGMRTLFEAEPGFESYELVAAGDAIISVSRWETAQQAEAATVAARSWVAEHLARALELQQSYVGELILSSAEPTTGP